MSERIYNVLFLCTGNSSRSILAESILNQDGLGHFRAFSAGSFPKPTINPCAIEVLKGNGYPIEALRSKSWDEFAVAGAPVMDFVFTVCDDAAGETCPVWPGHPMTAHWGIADPALATGSDADKLTAFVQAFRYLRNRISVFVSLPRASIDKMALDAELRRIGRMAGATAPSMKVHG
jgi:arsenate reductase (thioredoxin)